MNIDRLCAAIYEVNKEIATGPCNHPLMHDEDGCPFGGPHPQRIQLHHVLRTVPDDHVLEVDSRGDLAWYTSGTKRGCAVWNLTKTFEQQSEPTLRFLEEIICP